MKPFLALLAGLILCGAALQAQETAPQPTTPPAGATDTPKVAPLDYFNDKCGRCHGPYGSYYGKEFAKNLDDDKLREVVKAMCDGPAQAPLSDADLAPLVAFHRALRDDKPFIWVDGVKDTVINGETSPGATVAVESGTSTIDAKVDGHNWSATLPAPTDASKIIVHAKLNDKTTDLKLAQGNFAP